MWGIGHRMLRLLSVDPIPPVSRQISAAVRRSLNANVCYPLLTEPLTHSRPREFPTEPTMPETLLFTRSVLLEGSGGSFEVDFRGSRHHLLLWRAAPGIGRGQSTGRFLIHHHAAQLQEVVLQP